MTNCRSENEATNCRSDSYAMSHELRVILYGYFIFQKIVSNFLTRHPRTFKSFLWGHIHINRILSTYSSDQKSQKFKKLKKKLIFQSEHSSHLIYLYILLNIAYTFITHNMHSYVSSNMCQEQSLLFFWPAISCKKRVWFWRNVCNKFYLMNILRLKFWQLLHRSFKAVCTRFRNFAKRTN